MGEQRREVVNPPLDRFDPSAEPRNRILEIVGSARDRVESSSHLL